MRHVVAIALGLMSGFLVYMILAMVTGPQDRSAAFVFVTFFGGWAVSSYFLVRQTKTVSKVFARGFLLGAAEWLAVIPAGFALGGHTLSASSASDEASRAGEALGAGCFSVLTGGVAIGMALGCMTGFAVTYFIGREMKPETDAPSKKCPECAELVLLEARRCRHCGAIFEVPTQGTGAA